MGKMGQCTARQLGNTVWDKSLPRSSDKPRNLARNSSACLAHHNEPEPLRLWSPPYMGLGPPGTPPF